MKRCLDLTGDGPKKSKSKVQPTQEMEENAEVSDVVLEEREEQETNRDEGGDEGTEGVPTDGHNEHGMVGMRRSTKLEMLNSRRVEAETLVAETMEKFDEEFKRRKEDMKNIHENLVTIVNHHVEEYMKRLDALRTQFHQLMGEKVDEFMNLNDAARDEIDGQTFLQNSLMEVNQKWGLNVNF